MLAFLPVFAAALLAPLVSGTITINQPNSGGWIGNSTVTVAWTSSSNDDPQTFTIELGNPTISSGLLAQGPYAVGNNIRTSASSFSFLLPTVPPGSDYFVAFVAVDNINTVYANSSSFSISDNPSSSSVSSKSTTSTGSSTTHSASTTKHPHIGNNTSTTSTSTSTSIITSAPSSSSSFTELQVTTLSTTTTTTTKHGGATRMEAAWYVGVVGAFLGALFA